MEILGKIFGSTARIKIMRLFLLNKEEGFEISTLMKRSRVSRVIARKELSLLSLAQFVKKRKNTWYFDNSFPYTRHFESLLVSAEVLNKNSIINEFKKTGKVKLLIVSGAFIKEKDSRVDILIVGDGLKKKKIEDTLAKIEAEIGAELTYAFFDTAEFLYRLNMRDKLVRDIIDFPHEIVLEAKELSTHLIKKP